MSPADRRAAIIAATLPLLSEYGPSISTRQIADAAGIAEGTIFRVFPDKQSLIMATILSALDPEPTIRALRNIDRTVDIRDRIVAMTAVLARRLADNSRPLATLRHFAMGCPSDQARASAKEIFTEAQRARRLIIETAAEIIGTDAGRLRCSPTKAANLLFSMLFATAGPHSLPESQIDLDEVVTLLLDGLLLPQQQAADAPDPGPEKPHDRPETPHP